MGPSTTVKMAIAPESHDDWVAALNCAAIAAPCCVACQTNSRSQVVGGGEGDTYSSGPDQAIYLGEIYGKHGEDGQECLGMKAGFGLFANLVQDHAVIGGGFTKGALLL